MCLVLHVKCLVFHVLYLESEGIFVFLNIMFFKVCIRGAGAGAGVGAGAGTGAGANFFKYHVL